MVSYWGHQSLKQTGIDIDIVAGCSIGSLVGAAYACNKLSALEQWVCSFRYWDVLRLMDVSGAEEGCFAANAYLITIGILCPSRILTTVQDVLARSRRILALDESYGLLKRSTPCRTRVVQYAGLMSPVEHNGYWLVDGAVVNPVPVSLTGALGPISLLR